MSLAALGEVAEKFGDDDNVALHITTRANLQIRALPSGPDGQLPAEVVDAIAETGLLPAPEHELVRNILVSPLTGLDGGRADLRQVTTALDAGLVALPELAGLARTRLDRPPRTVMSNSFAFGGNNLSLILTRDRP